ncbi:MAG: aldo/keto reductase [Fibrobacterota bacterium]
MSKVVIFIQARMNSSRLPGKILLPIAGMPAVVLCARRSATSGYPVTVLTTTSAADDALCRVLGSGRIRCFRGSEENVIGRFIGASKQLSSRDIVVRLTADNVVPDGAFLKEMVERFKAGGEEYLGSLSPLDGLPYGLSAEVFTVAALRKAAVRPDALVHEHVTYRMRQGKQPYAPARLKTDLSRLRCTLDSPEDYQRLCRLFDGVRNPVTIGWQALCEKLIRLPDAPRFSVPNRYRNNRIHSELTLGTAQLGLNYGIANSSGQPSQAQAEAILCEAVRHGVRSFDTARAYGMAEERIGAAVTDHRWEGQVQVITKLDPLADLASNASEKEMRLAIDASVFHSCRNLRMQRLPVFLLHRWEHRHKWRGAAWKRLLELKNEGVIGTLGASLQTSVELLDALNEPVVGHVQFPFNILDWRFRSPKIKAAIARRKDVTVHVRSPYLQGLLLSRKPVWKRAVGISALTVLERLEKVFRMSGRKSLAEFCLAYVRAQPWIDSIVMGMESKKQIQENLRRFLPPPLTEAECEQVERTVGKAPEGLLNPALWRRE